MESTKEWFKDWFSSENYLRVYNHRGPHDAEKLSELIIQTIIPKPNSPILDSACGAGRHGIYLASKGYKVCGFDLSKSLLMKAREECLAKKVKLDLILTDIREVCFKTKFYAILNLFTSFGYFETDEENFRFVRHSVNFIEEGGYYILDYFNKYYLEKNIVAESERVIDELTIKESRKIDNNRVRKKIEILSDKDRQLFYESVRLYDRQYIVNRFADCGYKLINIFGDYNGNSYDDHNSPRLIAVFQR